MAFLCLQLINMSKYSIPHHQIIESALKNFNADFFSEHNIVFGGGTRIALELDEFRESVDIDLLCPNKMSYRAVREQVTNNTLGKIVLHEFNYVREIRADRDAVRTVIEYQGVNIKLEFVSFDNYDLRANEADAKFPIPYLDSVSCFYTKLLANADRKLIPPFKDIFDILAMYKEWGTIPLLAIELAESHYGKKVIVPDLIIALEDIIKNPDAYLQSTKNVKMKAPWDNEIVFELPQKLLEELR